MSDNPYASPTYTPVDKFAPRFDQNHHVYRPFPVLLQVVSVVAILCVILAVLSTSMEVVANLSKEAESFSSDLSPLEFGAWISAICLIPLNIVWGILYMVATYRIAANSHALAKQRPETSPGFAVGCNFIPILNLFKPYQVMKEFYVACGADTGSLLGWWWASHIFVVILSQISTRLSFAATQQQSAELAANMHQIAVLMDAISLPLFVALAFLSQRVLSRLAARHHFLASQTPDQTGWSPAMAPITPAPFSNWGGD